MVGKCSEFGGRGAWHVRLGDDWTRKRGTMSDHLRDIARRHRLVMLGNQPPEVQLVVRTTDWLFVRFLWEAFGNAAARPMALGRAVMATTRSGFSDLIHFAPDCVLVGAKDAEALAQVILRLFGDDAVRSRVSAAAWTAEPQAPAVVPGHIASFAEIASRE
jgi:hypothetical protein